MAFKFKQTTVAAIFGYLGVPTDKMEKFNLFGLKLEVTSDALLISSPSHGTSTKVNSNPTSITALKNGKLGSVTTKYLQKAVLAVIDSLPMHPSDWDGQFAPSVAEVTATADEAMTAKEKLATAATTGPVSGVEVFPPSKMKTAPTIKLRDATQLYQPVKGTSPSSRYWVVAVGTGVKAAARWEGSTLSIRMEGDGLVGMKHVLHGLGFNKVTDDHASMHLDVGSDTLLANRTLGAVLCSVGEFTAILSPVPTASAVKT